MCHYITAILPQQADFTALCAIAQQHQRQLILQEKSGLGKALLSGESYYLTTQGACDCGTALGCMNKPRENDTYQTAIKRLSSKGWSPAKISRWLKQKEQSTERIISERLSSQADDLERWKDFISEALTSNSTSYIAILLHWYRGPLTERIQVQGRQVITLSNLNKEILGQCEEDWIYEFRK